MKESLANKGKIHKIVGHDSFVQSAPNLPKFDLARRPRSMPDKRDSEGIL
jgi:hypothetical protein